MRIARVICSLVLGLGLLITPIPSQAQVAVAVSVRIGPPVLPVYVQPICPGPGFIWIPGYWAYGPYGYFWVPGTWVYPPEVGFLWTPGYWAWDDGFYFWHGGYWGPVVGYYGGINYGFGYPGTGFYGGYWSGGAFFYNRSVTNVNVTVVRNVYNTTVVNNVTTVNRVSFNGGPGGTTVRPSTQELEVARQRHVEMTSAQVQHQQAASSERTLQASVNHGRPDVAASARPGEFKGRHAVETRRPSGLEERPRENPRETERGNPPPNRGREREKLDRPPSSQPPDNGKRGGFDRPRENPRETERPVNPPDRGRGRDKPDRPPSSRSSDVQPSDPRLEQKHQREAEKMRQQQDAEHQRMQQQHAQEPQRLEQNRANDQRQADVQRRQQQQVEQLNRKHDQQTQKLDERHQKENQKQEDQHGKGERPPQH